MNDHVQVINERPIAILGQTHAEGVQTEQNTYAVDGVFVLRDAVAPDKLVPGLAVEGAHVRVDANMATNLSGCFACGDLAGKPYQYIKAAGQCCSPVGCGMAGKTKEVSLCCAAHDCEFGGPTAGLRR